MLGTVRGSFRNEIDWAGACLMAILKGRAEPERIVTFHQPDAALQVERKNTVVRGLPRDSEFARQLAIALHERRMIDLRELLFYGAHWGFNLERCIIVREDEINSGHVPGCDRRPLQFRVRFLLKRSIGI